MTAHAFLSLLLLAAPVPLPDAVLPALWPLAPDLRRLAIAGELLDPCEPDMLEREDAFACDLGILRRRYRELADAPPLSDGLPGGMLPPANAVVAALALNAAYRRHLQACLETAPRPAGAQWCRDALEEAAALGQVWEDARVASDPAHHAVPDCRHALARLRDVLGPLAYYRGQWPPPVPAARFQPF